MQVQPRHVVFLGCCALAALVATPTPHAAADPPPMLEPQKVIELRKVFEAGNLSGACRVGDHLVVGTDEGKLKKKEDNRKVQVLAPAGDDYGDPVVDVPLPADCASEIDIEALACEGKTVWVLGSHSAARTRVKDKLTHAANRDALTQTRVETSRDALYRFELTKDGPAKMKSTSLRHALVQEDVLDRAIGVPSKENGVDLEGLAVSGDRVYVGFRGPVLREGWVPIFAVAPPKIWDDPDADEDDPAQAEATITDRFFVHLDGLGIRDMAKIDGGFLLLAGPVGDGPWDFRLYRWDGKDALVGSGGPGGTVKLLGRFTRNALSGNPEGLVVLQDGADAWDLLLLTDDGTLAKDAPAKGAIFRIAK